MMRPATGVTCSALFGGACGYLLPGAYLLALTFVALCFAVFIFSKAKKLAGYGGWSELAAIALVTPVIFVIAFLFAMWGMAAASNIEAIIKAFLSLNS